MSTRFGIGEPFTKAPEELRPAGLAERLKSRRVIRRYFVVAWLQANAAASATPAFRLVHRTAGPREVSGLVHAEAGLPLTQPPAPSFTGPTVTAQDLSDPFFADGFETGNTAAWGASVP